MEQEKSLGQIAYEISMRADEPLLDDDALGRFWTHYLTGACRRKWESISSQIRQPLLDRIAFLEAENKRLDDELFQVRDDMAVQNGGVSVFDQINR